MTESNELADALRSFGARLDQIGNDLNSFISRQPKEQDSVLTSAKTIAEGALVFVTPFYVCGWTYLHQYYRTFGLSAYDLNIPIYDPLIFAISVASAGWDIALVTLVFVIAVTVGLSIMRDKKQWRVILSLFLILIFSCIFAYLGGKVARQRAQQRMDALDPTFPLVAVYMESQPEVPSLSGGAPSARGAPALESDTQFDKLEYKLLIHISGQYVIFRPLKSHEGPLQLFIIPENRVHHIEVQRGL